MNHILVIDDDQPLVNSLRKFLELEGFAVDAAYDYDSGLNRALSRDHELVVLVVLLSAMGEPADRIIGLQIGADDYLPKPFEPDELVARIHAILRRTRDMPTDGNEIRVGDVALSASRRAVVCAETPVELTAVEFNMLECLLRNAGSIVSRETLAERALGRPLAPFDRSVDVHVHNLRKKFPVMPHERIKAIRGAGYIYTPPLIEDLE